MNLLPLLVVCVAMAGAAAAQPRLTQEVNPFIGTGGHGHTYPGPSLPFGMIQPGPDTRLTGWDGCSGYHYSDSRLFGFSHTHLSGTGIPDYADVLLMPVTGEARLNNGADGRPGYASSFSHDEEVASPGYYAVTLKDYGIRAELTTTVRVGMHRYAFPAGTPAHVVLDLEHRDRVLEASYDVVSDTEVVGVRRSSSWARDQVVYFVIRFSRPFRHPVGQGFSPESRFSPTFSNPVGQGFSPDSLKAAFDFGDRGEPLLVKVAISAVSVDGARKNMEAELPGWDFDAVRRAADAAWEKELSKIRVEGGTPDERTRFYTAMYHAMLSPNVYMDVDGPYLGLDRKVHRADGFTYYTVFSLWDTFRALHPLLTLIDRERTRDFIQTFLRQYEQGGRLPVWELAANETDTMIGYHAVPVIADAVAKGIDGFDLDLAFRAMTHSAELDHFGLAAYKRNGFIDGAEEAESVSRTLEYAYDDWAIAQVAKRLGREAEYARYLRRAQAYKHLFDPSTGFMRARVEGLWMAPFDPAEVNNHYTEANAWQYSFFVPHDVDGLMRLLGGDAALARKLDALFSADSRTTGRDQADITGLIGQYAHGNEPSHHMAYLYAYAGQPWKTQAMVRRILDTLYGSGPDGLAGNEDCGQMSAWYVFSALGFYPVTPGSTQYVIGTPIFSSATIAFESGREFVIRAQGTPHPYIQRATLNGAAYGKAFLEHDVLVRGGELVFELGAEPNRAWGAAVEARPRSSVGPTVGRTFRSGISGMSGVSGVSDTSAVSGAPVVIPAPFVASGTRVFRGTQQITFGCADPEAEIWVDEARYTGAVTIAGSRTVRAYAVRGGVKSPTISIAFRQLTDFPRLTLSAPYAPQYAAAGDDTLIDGLRGGTNFRVGRWQGWQGVDLDATVDLGESRDIRHVSMGFLQDTGSWIFMPRRIVVEASDDGTTFREVAGVENRVSEREAKPVTADFGANIDVKARYVRVKVQRYGKLPDWHPGAGNEAWFFADEITIR